MELYLQFGYGMMEHTATLLEEWGGGGVVLSPRDLEQGQLARMAARVVEIGAEPLLDPQCYIRDSDHYRLTAHGYWQTFKGCTTANLTGGTGAGDVVEKLAELDRTLGIERHILPGLLGGAVSEDWFLLQERFIEAGAKVFPSGTLIATIALSDEAVRDEAQIEAVIERAAAWPVAGFYLVTENPSGYLVEDPVWLSNVLILASGLKLLRRTVIVGYSNHQLLCLAAGNIDIMASGTYLNVRAFPVGKFYTPEEDEISRRATWYYCPQALSEYKVPFLDIALRNGVLDLMRPDPALGSDYTAPLFMGAMPTSVQWKEPAAFRHYLTCLRSQCARVSAPAFEAAMGTQRQLLDSAEVLLGTLRAAGVFGQDRDFSRVLDANRAALITLARISQMIASERDANVRFDYVLQAFGEHGGGGGWMTRRVKPWGWGCGSTSTVA